MKFWIAALALFSLTLVAEEQFPAYELPNTQVHQLPANNSGRHYEVWVDLPPSYATSTKSFPVLFVTDANYAFPLVRSIRNRLGAGGQNIEDFVLVGLSYAQGDSPIDSRSLDYTPTNVLLGKKSPDDDDGNYAGKAYGGAAAYADYLRQQVIPFVLNHYRIDATRKFYVGHSYGGLLGAQILLTQPDTFDSYILSSPSFWFDQNYMLRLVTEFSTKQRKASAVALKKSKRPLTVQLYAAEYEQIKAGPRYAKRISIVADMQLFEQQLRTGNFTGLSMNSQVIADEDHLSVFPAMISRALVKLLPGYGPYTAG